MRRLLTTIIIGFTAIAFSAAVMTAADARGRGKKHGKVRTLIIKKRSFLDSGKHQQPYATRNYVIMGTHLATPPYAHQGRYGSNVLPGRFGAFGPR